MPHHAPDAPDFRHCRLGSNVSLTLYFVRFALGMNFVLALIWGVFALGPVLLQRPATFRWDQIQSYSIISIIQGYGLDNTFLLYGETHG